MARRPATIQNEIWTLLETINKHGKPALTESLFDSFERWYGINITSFTVFLFWIDAENFLPLDQNTVQLLRQTGAIKKRPSKFLEYADLLANADIKNYPQLSEEAVVNRDLEYIPIKETTHQVTQKKNTVIDTQLPDQPQQVSGCRILGLRIYRGTPLKWRKMLDPGKIYTLYNAFEFQPKIAKQQYTNDAVIKYDLFKDAPLYDIKKTLKIHISAIVGGNGSGKSTLTELIFISINNFVIQGSDIPNKLERVNDIFLDMYFITDALYKLSISGELCTLQRYSRSKDGFFNPKSVHVADFDFEQFFYTISNNYALYSPNSNQLGQWVRQLFHKNDQYQIPIVINPFRNEGNIDINRENKLLKTRLVANLLLPVETKQNIRKLTDSRYAETLSFHLDERKFDELYRYLRQSRKFSEAESYWVNLLGAISKAFKISIPYPVVIPEKPANFLDAAWMYLVKKVISICMTYPSFNSYFEPENNNFPHEKLGGLIEELQRDTSHVTHKFYQVIHFFNYQHLKKVRSPAQLRNNILFKVEKLADEIKDILDKMDDKRFGTIHFAPPSFLDPEIILTDNINLSDLSSGEKQRIFSVSSVAYHLTNIDSNADQSELITYPAANLIFDEVELYFHPEMQRQFVKYVLDYLSRLELETVNSINIIFVTHSPFILSDIPAYNILFLGKTSVSDTKTFGANIHTLLADSFFLKESFMGEYEKETINDLISFLINEPHILKWDENNSAQIINVIGEPLLKDRLKEIYRKRYEKGHAVNEKINALYNQINILRNEENK